jgi:hypothetical protein
MIDVLARAGKLTVTPAGRVDGVPAMRAHAPGGDITITRDSPYRVLNFDPSGTATTGALPSWRSSRAELAAAPTSSARGGDVTIARLLADLDGGAASGAVAPTSLSARQADGVYADTEAQTPKLVGAVDPSKQFSMTSSAQGECSAAGCTITSNFTTSGGSSSSSGQVNAEMTATATINGLPAGECSASGSFPMDSPGSLTCSILGAGAVWQEANAEAEAAARAAAPPGSSYRWTVLSEGTADVFAEAVSQAQETGLEQEEERDQQAPRPSLPQRQICDVVHGGTRDARTPPIRLAVAADPTPSPTNQQPTCAAKPFWTSPDPLVGDLANDLEAALPGKVVGTNLPVYRPNGSLATDADIEMDDAIIQVKSGSGRGALTQAMNTARYGGKPVVVYGPNLGRQMVGNLNDAPGIHAATTLEQLVSILLSLMG